MNTRINKPNILFIFSDQHRWCDMGCYGNGQVSTPNFDAFSQDAIRFNNCISNSPVCVPARGSLLTGLMPLKHGAVTNDLPINQDVKSIAHVLKDQGYHTGYIGKWHLAGVPRDQYISPGKGRLGFEEWKVCNCSHDYLDAYYYDEKNNRIEVEAYEPIEQTRLASEFIERNKREDEDKPWCLYLSWGPPHDPYKALPDRYLDMYGEMELNLRDNVPLTIMHTLEKSFTKDEMEDFIKGYYAHITALDEQFGKLMETLKDTGQLDNTLIIYTSDHGDMLGSQGVTNKQWPYDESIRVPLMASWKGKTIKGLSHELIGLVDLPVSILGLLGMQFPGEVQGQDLHRLFIEKDAEGLNSCYITEYIPCHQAAARGTREWRGVRTKTHTYARSVDDDGFVLFHNIIDPFQMNNLIDDPENRDVKHQLKHILDGHILLHDKLLTWQDFIREFDLKDEWNRSQKYFDLPLLED